MHTSTKRPTATYAMRQPTVTIIHAMTGTRRLIPVMLALPSNDTAVPRFLLNQRETTALATTGPVAASPSDASAPYTMASCQRFWQRPVAASDAAKRIDPQVVTTRAPKRSTRVPTHGMNAP